MVCNFPTYNCAYSLVQILILADESLEDSAIQADSRSLATLLLIRDIQVCSLTFLIWFSVGHNEYTPMSLIILTDQRARMPNSC